jgi:radical SAM protein with 4Fe4S-binding SPASM domain
MTMAGFQGIPQVFHTVKHISFGDQFILIDPDIPIWAVIDEIGLDIFNFCNGKNSVRDIINKLSSLYEIEAYEIEDDVIQFLSRLYNNKLVFQDLNERKSLIKNLQDQYKQVLQGQLQKGPKGASIIVTGYCNLRCKHCYQDSSPIRKDLLTVDEVKSILLYLSKSGSTTVAFNGGEALTWDGIYECMDLAHDLGLSITLATNGLFFNDDVIPFYQARSNINIQISLDGATEATHDFVRGKGMFQRSMNAVQKLCNAGLGKRISFSFTPMKRNVFEAEALIDLASKLGIGEVKFTRFHLTGRGSEKLRASTKDLLELEHLLLEKGKHLKGKLKLKGLWRDSCAVKEHLDTSISCPMFEMIKIDPSGYVFSCSQFMDKKFSVGNIRTETLENILIPERKRPLVELAFSRHQTVEQCSQCAVKKYCVSGCTAETYSAYGDVYHPDPHCEVRNAVAKETLFETASKGGSI